uniref:Glycoprotein D n=1 Tax=Panagrellus redivivus TaxID=6233 RepID=A0A7E4V490_PANRE
MGIPDSEDKSYIYEKEDLTCLSHKTLPDGFTFRNGWPGKPKFQLYSEDFVCPYDYLFNLTSEKPDHMSFNFSLDPLERFLYLTHETCREGSFTQWLYDIIAMQVVDLWCRYYNEQYNFQNIVYNVNTAPGGICNYWFCLGHLEIVERSPVYPSFTLPTDEDNYFLAGSSDLPNELLSTEKGLAIDLVKAAVEAYTVYKTALRPIQTIEVAISKHCSKAFVSIEFDGTCAISIDLTHKMEYYVNGKQNEVWYRPTQIVITFTYSTAYLYTFDKLGFYPLTECTFSPTHKDSAEYSLKAKFDRMRSSDSCKYVKLRFLDAAAIKRWTTKTMPTMTTTTTTSTETPTAEVPTSTASTKIWAIVAVICFVLSIVVVVTGLLLFRWFKMR